MQPRPGHERLRRDLSQVPITAVALLSRAPASSPSSSSASRGLFVLAGEDSAVAVYEADAGNQENDGDDGSSKRGRFVCCIPVFEDQPVHGIHVQPDAAGGGGAVVLVWGGRSVAFFSLVEPDGGTATTTTTTAAAAAAVGNVVVARATAPDWIYHGAISPFDSSRAVLATAHNEVIPVRYSPGDAITLGPAISPSRPMLYSAHLTWTSEDVVLVAGGTVFGHVIVWKHRLGPGSGEAAPTTEMLFNLQGHEGSIFGVDISPPMTLSTGGDDGSPVRLLASCSDDRTIRVWDITERSDGRRRRRSWSRGSSQAAIQIIDTGFGSRHVAEDGDEDDDESGQGGAPIAMVMGHASRIWSVKFAPLCGVDTLAVYSFGEDATAQRWHLQLSSHASAGQEPAQQQLSSRKTVSGNITHDRTFSLHSGKHLWSNTILVGEDSIHIATGGADSQISLIEEPIKAALGKEAIPLGRLTTLDVHDMLRSLSSHPKTTTTAAAAAPNAKEIISRYDFLTHDQILVTTSHARLLLGCLARSNTTPEWQDIAVDERLLDDLRLCYVIKTIAHGAALLCTTSGNIYFFRLPGQEVSHVVKLPGKIVEVNCLSARAQNEELNPSPVEVLVHLHGSPDSHYLTLDPSTGALHGQGQVRGLDPRFVATSAAKINDLLAIGSRHGWLSILRRDEGETYRPILDMATRSRDAITAIVPLPRKSPGTQGTPTPTYILATSRDGKYRIYEMDRQAASVSLHLRHETSPPFGPMIVGAWFTPYAVPELILYGFRSKDFVIWNETRREELATVECGGAHRTFQLTCSESDPGRYRFAFTKTSKLTLCSSERLTHRSLRSGTHGREIRALSSNGRYIASGAEDTTIRIWEYHQPAEEGGQAEMRCVATMKAHVTGIQRILWFENDHLFSSAGNEEFFAWRVRKLESDYTGLAVFCESVFTDKSADGDLRIMDFDVCRPDSGGIIMVTMGFSNSTLKTYRYTCGEGSFELIAEGSYTGACFTQTRHLGMRDGVMSVLTASTDGHLALWRAEPGESNVRKYVLEQAAQLHQNSIKSLDMTKLGEGYGYVVFTGGDDNGVGVTLVGEASGDTKAHHGWALLRRSFVSRAHAAAVTGVVLVCQGAEIVGVSVSNDQRVKVWGIPGYEGGRIKLLGEACSGVADPGDIALVDESRGEGVAVVVGGVGMEAWSLSMR